MSLAHLYNNAADQLTYFEVIFGSCHGGKVLHLLLLGRRRAIILEVSQQLRDDVVKPLGTPGIVTRTAMNPMDPEENALISTIVTWNIVRACFD